LVLCGSNLVLRQFRKIFEKIVSNIFCILEKTLKYGSIIFVYKAKQKMSSILLLKPGLNARQKANPFFAPGKK
jgi:hypothetical protein